MRDANAWAGSAPSVNKLCQTYPAFAAVTRDTISNTGATSGIKHNVIPADAEATLDCRLLPGESYDDFIKGMRDVIDDEKVEVEVVFGSMGPASSFETEMVSVIEDVVREQVEGAMVIPSTCVGFTDSRVLRRHGVHSYGFVPTLDGRLVGRRRAWSQRDERRLRASTPASRSSSRSSGASPTRSVSDANTGRRHQQPAVGSRTVRHPQLDGQWALILGASSGFGGTTAVALAEAGMNIAGVHLDRRSTMANVERIVGEIESHGRQAVFHNMNAADAGKRGDMLDSLREQLEAESGPSTVRVLLHSLAFGTLGPYIGAKEDRPITPTPDGDDPRRNGQLGRLLDPGHGRPRPPRRRQQDLRHDLRRRHESDPAIRLAVSAANARPHSLHTSANSRSNSRRKASPPTRLKPASPTHRPWRKSRRACNSSTSPRTTTPQAESPSQATSPKRSSRLPSQFRSTNEHIQLRSKTGNDEQGPRFVAVCLSVRRRRRRSRCCRSKHSTSLRLAKRCQ